MGARIEISGMEVECGVHFLNQGQYDELMEMDDVEDAISDGCDVIPEWYDSQLYEVGGAMLAFDEPRYFAFFDADDNEVEIAKSDVNHEADTQEFDEIAKDFLEDDELTHAVFVNNLYKSYYTFTFPDECDVTAETFDPAKLTVGTVRTVGCDFIYTDNFIAGMFYDGHALDMECESGDSKGFEVGIAPMDDLR